MPKITQQVLEEELETDGLSSIWLEPQVGKGRLV